MESKMFLIGLSAVVGSFVLAAVNLDSPTIAESMACATRGTNNCFEICERNNTNENVSARAFKEAARCIDININLYRKCLLEKDLPLHDSDPCFHLNMTVRNDIPGINSADRCFQNCRWNKLANCYSTCQKIWPEEYHNLSRICGKHLPDCNIKEDLIRG